MYLANDYARIKLISHFADVDESLNVTLNNCPSLPSFALYLLVGDL